MNPNNSELYLARVSAHARHNWIDGQPMPRIERVFTMHFSDLYELWESAALQMPGSDRDKLLSRAIFHRLPPKAVMESCVIIHAMITAETVSWN